MASEMKIYPRFSLNCSYFSATHFRISICNYSRNTRMYRRTTCTQGPNVSQHALSAHTNAHTNTHTYLLSRLMPHWLDCIQHQQISFFFCCSSATSVLWLRYFWYLLPIIHFITSPPFLSAVFYHTYYHFLEGVREGKKNSSRVRGSVANTTNQHYLVCMGRPRLSGYKLACGSRPTVHCISQMPSM